MNVAGGDLVWQAPAAFVPVGAYPAAITLVEVGGNTLSVTFSLVTTLHAHMLTYTASSNSIALPMFGETWTADWVVHGRHQFRSTKRLKSAPNDVPEPYLRWNSFGTHLVGDKANGAASNSGSIGQTQWGGLGTWSTTAALQYFGGTFALDQGAPSVEQRRDVDKH